MISSQAVVACRTCVLIATLLSIITHYYAQLIVACNWGYYTHCHYFSLELSCSLYIHVCLQAMCLRMLLEFMQVVKWSTASGLLKDAHISCIAAVNQR